MSSTILYKFRSGATFEALPLPGTAARLFDVKKAIVFAKKLDSGGSMEFDLAIRDATTNEEYTDDSMILPRGTRLIVHRLPAAKGHGIMAKIARNQYGSGLPPLGGMPAPSSVPSNFYTIDSRAHDDDEEFVSSNDAYARDEEKELAALRAATSSATAMSSSIGRTGMRPAPPQGVAGAGYRPHQGSMAGGATPSHHGAQRNNFRVPRPNADPELRAQERQATTTTKRATGIPRTFLNLTAAQNADGSGDGDAMGNIQVLKPNAIGFQELVNRGGGLSETASGAKRDLEYAIKVTATTVPDYLQCAICHDIVRDATILPWDAEGRTTCESCIRDALTQNGFRCPLTGQEGVSPDDLLPNHALRKAAEQFIKGVMEKMDEIVKQQVDDDVGDDVNGEGNEGIGDSTYENDAADKGVVVSKRASVTERKRKQEEEDPFGAGDDEFGGDVFAVDVETPEERNDFESQAEKMETEHEPTSNGKTEDDAAAIQTSTSPDVAFARAAVQTQETDPGTFPQPNLNDASSMSPIASPPGKSDQETESHNENKDLDGQKNPPDASSVRREISRRRGPPVGYTMGPAGGALDGPQDRSDGRNAAFHARGRGRHGDNRDGLHGGWRGGGRGERGGRFGAEVRSGRGEFSPRSHYRQGDDARVEEPAGHRINAMRDDQPMGDGDNLSRGGMKRGRSPSEGAPADDGNSTYSDSRYDSGGRGAPGRDHRPDYQGRGRGRFRGGGYGNGGGRGGWNDRGGRVSFRGRGSFRGGRGRY